MSKEEGIIILLIGILSLVFYTLLLYSTPPEEIYTLIIVDMTLLGLYTFAILIGMCVYLDGDSCDGSGQMW